MKLSFAQSKENAVRPSIRTSGMAAAHYAPVTPMELHNTEQIVHRAEHLSALKYKVVVLTLGRKITGIESGIRQHIMPAQAELFAHDLYAALHNLDQAGYDYLLLESPPATKTWLAVNDRLQRAAHRA